VVGDTLFLKTEIPFQLTTRSSEIVDLREYELSELGVGFSILLYKNTGFGTFGTVPLTQEFLVEDLGDTEIQGDFIVAYCEQTINGFESRYGIVLNEPGTYQIRTRGDGAFPVNYFVDIIDGDVRIDINAFLAQSSENGDFTFIVN